MSVGTDIKRSSWRVTAAMMMTLLLFAANACTIPGAIAPSTIPLGDEWVQLSPRESISSCGYTILTIPIKNPKSVSELIEEMTRSRGGDALIEVSSESSVVFYLLGVANCLEVRGKIVKIAH